MANDLRKNPWRIDTASSNYLRSGVATPNGGTSAVPQAFSGKGPMWISSIQWTGNSATTDTVVIQDENANTFLTLVSKSDKSIVEVNYDRPLRKWDIAIPTLASGVVAVNFW